MARIDHTACTHPRTPAGRSACRRMTAQRDLGINMDGHSDSNDNRGVAKNDESYISDHIRKVAANHKIKARMDRRKPMTARGAFEKTYGTTVTDSILGRLNCPNEAIHSDGTICACGFGRPL